MYIHIYIGREREREREARRLSSCEDGLSGMELEMVIT